MYPLVRELAEDGIPVTVTCRVLKIARQPYYRWLAKPVTDAELATAYRANALFDAHREDPEFGYRFLVDEAKEAGEPMAERTAWRICSELGWWSVFGKKRGRNGKKPGPPVHDDLVMRDFTADAPNTLWLSDITEHWTREGKLYLWAIKDAYSNRIVGYSIDSRMKSRIAVAALDNAVARRRAEGVDVAGCLLHTDRGSQFRSRKLVHQLNRHDMVGSMGRVGAAGDNAAMESFFSLLQKNVLDRRVWTTREELRIAIVTWIEKTYHRRRRQAALGRLTPVEYELIMKPAAPPGGLTETVTRSCSRPIGRLVGRAPDRRAAGRRVQALGSAASRRMNKKEEEELNLDAGDDASRLRERWRDICDFVREQGDTAFVLIRQKDLDEGSWGNEIRQLENLRLLHRIRETVPNTPNWRGVKCVVYMVDLGQLTVKRLQKGIPAFWEKTSDFDRLRRAEWVYGPDWRVKLQSAVKPAISNTPVSAATTPDPEEVAIPMLFDDPAELDEPASDRSSGATGT